jgi:hypothetical protein
MKDVTIRLLDLSAMHPRLLWDTIITAAAAVLAGAQTSPPFQFSLEVRNVPGFGDGELRLRLDSVDVPEEWLLRVRRTYEPSRLIELTAIAIAGIGLHIAGGHEILDVAVRGSAADYLVDEAHHRLEIAGRSRRSDMETAWQQKWRRLEEAQEGGCYVCVVEFETPSGRLAFAD